MNFRLNTLDRNQSGVAYVELLVVIAIIAVVATLALMSWGQSREKLKLQNAANGLKIAFERSRFDSVKRRPDNLDTFSRVVISGSSTEGNQYTLRTFLDPSNPSTPTDTSTSTTPDGVKIIPYTGLAMTFPVTVSFNLRGETFAYQGGDPNQPVSPQFIVCYGGCTASESMIVVVTLSGTVQLLPGTSSIPSFTTPGTTDPGDGSDVNEMVTFPGPGSNPFPTATPIGGDPGGTPTPDPSVSPTVSPDPSVTPDPSPTDSPTATPTATPTPTGTPTATPTATATPTPPPPCTSSAAAGISGSWKNKSPVTITVNYQNATGTAFTISRDNSNFTVAPTSQTVTGTGSFPVTVKFPNGANQGTVNVTISGSGCGTTTVTGVAN